MAKKKSKKAWWDQLPDKIGGDVIVVELGDNARNVAAGKNVTQSVYKIVGEPAPDDKQVIEQKLSEVMATFGAIRGQLDAATSQTAEIQMAVLEGELTKTEEDEVPSASTITMIGDWLLDNIPEMAEILASLFATPAVGKVVAKAGEAAVRWVKKRFGSERSKE